MTNLNVNLGTTEALQINIAIYNLKKEAVIDLLDEYMGSGCYADYSIDELREILLNACDVQNIEFADIFEKVLAYN